MERRSALYFFFPNHAAAFVFSRHEGIAPAAKRFAFGVIGLLAKGQGVIEF